MRITRILIIMGLMAAIGACEDSPRSRNPDGGGSGEPPGESAVRDPDPSSAGDCDTLLEMTIRDFSESHPDFERAHLGWGPAVGIVADTLGQDRKPVFVQTIGQYQIVQDEAQKQSYTFSVNNWVDSANPMFRKIRKIMGRS